MQRACGVSGADDSYADASWGRPGKSGADSKAAIGHLLLGSGA